MAYTQPPRNVKKLKTPPEKARLNFYFSPFTKHNNLGQDIPTNVILKFEPLNVLQKIMIRLISNSDFLEHTEPLFYRLKILKVKDIYKYFTGICMHKSLQMGKYQTQHSLNTRNRNLAQPVFQRLTQGHAAEYILYSGFTSVF